MRRITVRAPTCSTTGALTRALDPDAVALHSTALIGAAALLLGGSAAQQAWALWTEGDGAQRTRVLTALRAGEVDQVEQVFGSQANYA